jgi:predicted lysophospholipase L1 biosynthesis ABC-type transport system permease subunit
MSNWEDRPLSDAQATYAALDAHCLLGLLSAVLQYVVDTDVSAHSNGASTAASTGASATTINEKSSPAPHLPSLSAVDSMYPLADALKGSKSMNDKSNNNEIPSGAGMKPPLVEDVSGWLRTFIR